MKNDIIWYNIHLMKSITMNKKVQKVDRKKRNILITAYLILIILTIPLFIFLPPFFKDIYQGSRLGDLIELANLLQLSIFILISIPAIYLIRTGIKIILQKRYPYKGMILIQDMKILEGKEAIKFGYRLIILGTITLIFLTGSIFITRRINKNFLENPFSAMNYNISNNIMKLFPTPSPSKTDEIQNENK